MGRVGGSKGVVGGEDWGLIMVHCHTMTTESVFVKLKTEPENTQTHTHTGSRNILKAVHFLK